MYRVEITYDTGDSFHQEHDVKHVIEEIEWASLEKAKQALKDIEEHYMLYMICHKEWNAGKKDKEDARAKAMNAPWCSEVCGEKSAHRDYWNYSLLLEDDNGERKNVHCCWVGYFEHLVGADIIDSGEEGMSFRT